MNRSPDVSTLRWRTSSYSSGNGNECVEVADTGALIAVRDSKNPGGPRFAFSRHEITRLAGRIKRGDLDL